MPEVKRFIGQQRGVGAGATPSNIAIGGEFAAAVQASENAQKLAEKSAEQYAFLQGQKDHSDFLGAQIAFENAIKKTKMDLLNDPATLEHPVDYAQKFQGEMHKIVKYTDEVLLKHSTPEAKSMWKNYLAKEWDSTLIEADAEGKKRFMAAEKTKIPFISGELVRQAASAPTEEDRKKAMDLFASHMEVATKNMILSRGEAAQELSKFEQNLLYEEASILGRSNPEALLEETAKKQDGKFARLDPNKLSVIETSAHTRLERRTAIDRQNERLIENAQNDRNLEINSLIASGKKQEANEKLNFYVDLRIMKDDDVRKHRSDIAADIKEFDVPEVAERVRLDVRSINPKTTMAQIDDLVRRKQLSLKTGVEAKEQLGQAIKAQRSEFGRLHAQAEQTLRVLTGVKEGMFASITQDSPADRIFKEVFQDLNKRSIAFQESQGGKEDPMAVVNEWRPKIDAALGKSAAFKPKEILDLYPTWDSLNQARKDGKISEEAYQDSLIRRYPPRPEGAESGGGSTTTPAKPSGSEPAKPPATRQQHGR